MQSSGHVRPARGKIVQFLLMLFGYGLEICFHYGHTGYGGGTDGHSCNGALMLYLILFWEIRVSGKRVKSTGRREF